MDYKEKEVQRITTTGAKDHRDVDRMGRKYTEKTGKSVHFNATSSGKGNLTVDGRRVGNGVTYSEAGNILVKLLSTFLGGK